MVRLIHGLKDVKSYIGVRFRTRTLEHAHKLAVALVRNNNFEVQKRVQEGKQDFISRHSVLFYVIPKLNFESRLMQIDWKSI